jgi:acyl dehydratase
MSDYHHAEIGVTMVTAGRTISEADVVNFAGISGDFNHIHTDAEEMKGSNFGERIVHGALVFSIMTGLLWQTRTEAQRAAEVAFYGVDRLRFTSPVFLGDTIHVKFEVADKEPRDHPTASGIVRYDTRVLNQDDEVVLACEVLTLQR